MYVTSSPPKWDQRRSCFVGFWCLAHSVHMLHVLFLILLIWKAERKMLTELIRVRLKTALNFIQLVKMRISTRNELVAWVGCSARLSLVTGFIFFLHNEYMHWIRFKQYRLCAVINHVENQRKIIEHLVIAHKLLVDWGATFPSHTGRGLYTERASSGRCLCTEGQPAEAPAVTELTPEGAGPFPCS